jgi:hypothetical protein
MTHGDREAAARAGWESRSAALVAQLADANAAAPRSPPSPRPPLRDHVRTRRVSQATMRAQKIAERDARERSEHGVAYYGSLRATPGQPYASATDLAHLEDVASRRRFLHTRNFDPVVPKSVTTLDAVQARPGGLHTGPSTPFHDPPPPSRGPFRAQLDARSPLPPFRATTHPGSTWSAAYALGTPLFQPNL